MEFNFDLDNVYTYGIDTFGIRQAELYENEIWKLVDGLSLNWPFFSECRHLPTKSKMYRWIILESHLIIYRITATEIQVLRIVHFHRSIYLLQFFKQSFKLIQFWVASKQPIENIPLPT